MVVLDLANPTPFDVKSRGAAAASNSFFMGKIQNGDIDAEWAKTAGQAGRPPRTLLERLL
jgi:hypothetical protein